MLSLIVALALPGATAGPLRYALSRHAATGAGGPLEGNGSLADHGSAPPALLPAGSEVVAMVPAHMLSWHRITLPKVGAARLRSALDGLLEERLLDEPQTLHFALEPGAAAGASVWVAACDASWLRAALQAFETAGRPVSRVVPETAPLPDGSPPALHAIGNPDSAWLIRTASDGVQVLPLAAATRASLALGDAPLVLAEPSVAALAEQALGAKVQVRHSAQSLVDAARTAWDLAQFDLASTGRTRLVRRASLAWAQWAGSAAWRPARWGLAALVAINLLGLNAWAWKERSSLDAKQAEARSLLTRTFPKVPIVVDAPVQMEREVAALRQATGALSARDLEPMLASVADNAPSAPAPSAIEFSGAELILRGFKPNAAEARSLTTALAAAGYASRTEGDTWVVKTASGARP